ncbi:MAG: serine/threonine transporter SstT, partial [Eubacteriales bacterium]|nr:serine/threonine transporter SstT [Eubacteriales bacterium]
MKEILKKWHELSLVLRILIGMAIGTVLGLAVPQLSAVKILGTVFIGALKGVAPVLVFVLVMSALANAGGGIGKRFRTVIFLYIISTLVAAVVSVAASFMFPVTMTLVTGDISTEPPGGIGEVLTNLISNMVSNPVMAIANANYIGILFWAVIFGTALRIYGQKETRVVISDFSDMASCAVRWVIQFAPFGICGIVFETVSENGMGIFMDYGRLLAVLVGCMIFVALVADPLIMAIALKRNPYPLVFTCLKESGITAFFTRSSAANVPINMQLCERLGLEKDFYSVSIPLGATINMDGAAVTITVMTLAVANTLGIHVDFTSAVLLSVIATLSACGASGVAGGSLLLIPMACSLFGISSDISMQA